MERQADQILRGASGENKRSAARDIEKASYEAGIISLGELEHYDPGDDWDTMDSVFAVVADPVALEFFDSTECADDDGNIRARNQKALDRRKLAHIVRDDENWGPTREEIPLLGASEGPRKTCARCERSKGVQFFYENTRSKDGLHSWCKVCMRSNNKSGDNTA